MPEGPTPRPSRARAEPAAHSRSSTATRTPAAGSHVIIVDRKRGLPPLDPELTVITARDYVARPDAVKARQPRVLNLSRAYDYLGTGYYVSLLAEARGQRVMPDVRTILDVGERALHRPVLKELEERLRERIRRMSNPPETSFHLFVLFGVADDRRFQDLARRLFEQLRAPLLKLAIRWKDDWVIHSLEALSLEELKPEQHEQFRTALATYTRSSWKAPKVKSAARPCLALLQNPKDPTAPSDVRALKKFIKAGDALGMDVELIDKKHFSRLAEYDGLFIRETTAIDHHTYRFARRAQDEGMPVIDDPDSILKCTNKVYLAEILKAHRLPAPKTVIVDKARLATLESEIPYPIVLKIPDGSCSRGVFRVRNRDELEATSATLFEESDLILAQEFMYTEFDWRVGILNRMPLYACQYRMAKKHWKIQKHTSGGLVKEGEARTFLVDEVPTEVIQLATAAAGMIGDGLYGVDIKQNDMGLFVIEINDNPSIECGVEDERLKDDLYRTVMREMLRRIDAAGR